MLSSHRISSVSYIDTLGFEDLVTRKKVKHIGSKHLKSRVTSLEKLSLAEFSDE